ncbi:MAG: hypothetical protein K0R54_1307 [Clostridiaceae bacterium]|jgi:hypothetical protein|nr:hypothetical protein [Clostridiaceae bacterium]
MKKGSMRKNSQTKVFLSTFLVIAIGIICWHYVRNFNLRNKVPSNDWSKEVLISSGDINTYNKIIKYKDGILAAHDLNNKVKIVYTDFTGKKIREAIFNSEGDNVNDINIVLYKDYIHLCWSTTKDGINKMVNLELDSNLKQVDKTFVDGIKEIKQNGDSTLFLLFDNKVQVIDYSNDREGFIATEAKANSPILGAAAKLDEKQMFAFLDKEGNYYYFNYDNKSNKTISPELLLAGKLDKTTTISYYSSSLCFNDKNGYIIVENKGKDEYLAPRLITFSLSGKEQPKTSVLREDGMGDLSDVVTESGHNSIRIFATASRKFNKKSKVDIMTFTIENNKNSDWTLVSRTEHNPTFKSVYGNYIVFTDFYKDNELGVYLASKESAFKNANNGIRSSEKSLALQDTMSDLLNSITFTFVMGIGWILPGLALIGVACFFNYAIKGKNRIIIFLLTYSAAALIKIYVVYKVVYVKYITFMPYELSNLFIGVLICIVISLLCCCFGIMKYKKNIEDLPMPDFAAALIIDTLITQLIFVPFMI